MWQRLQQVARRESAYTPSEGAVRTVNASLRPIGRLASCVMRSRRLHRCYSIASAARLLAGVRSAESASQQLLYGVGDYRIDVRIEPQMDSEKVVLIGQVLNSADPDERLSAAPVSLLKGRKILAESVTSEFGEFQIECDLQEGFRLVVLLPDRKRGKPPAGRTRIHHAGEMPTHVAENNMIRKTSRIKKKGTRTKD